MTAAATAAETDHGPAFLGIGETGQLFRQGALTPTALTRLCLDRIARLDPALNAFAEVLAGAALDVAGRAGRELAAGRDRGPLHGIPVAVKDIMDVAGTTTRFGSSPRFAQAASRDAALVRRLRDAGAVLIGKTALLEFAYGAVHPEAGQTNNPWDARRTSGGSSGGSAAAVAAGLASAAIGTDTGGSVRVPAAYCGIVGLKPGFGVIPLDGVQPLSWSLDHAGILARTCADAGLVLDALSGRPGPAPAPPPVAGLRFGVPAPWRDHPAMSAGCHAAFADACAALRAAGAAVGMVEVPGLDGASQALMDVILPEAAVVHADRLAAMPEAFSAQTRAQLEQGLVVPATALARAHLARAALRDALVAALGRCDAILSPAVPWAAPPADPTLDSPDGAAEMLYAAPFNLTGLPAVAIPCGADGDGLPLSLQIATRPGADREALALGTALEALFPVRFSPAMR